MGYVVWCLGKLAWHWVFIWVYVGLEFGGGLVIFVLSLLNSFGGFHRVGFLELLLSMCLSTLVAKLMVSSKEQIGLEFQFFLYGLVQSIHKSRYQLVFTFIEIVPGTQSAKLFSICVDVSVVLRTMVVFLKHDISIVTGKEPSSQQLSHFQPSLD